MNVAARVACAGVVALTAGCGAFRAIEQHPDGPALERVHTEWQVRLTSPGLLAYFPEEFATPAYDPAHRVVVAGSSRGDLVCADFQTGAVRWTYPAFGKIRSAPAVDKSAAYIGTTDGALYKIGLRDGTLSWDRPYSTSGAISSTPALGGGMVVFQNNQGRTFALDSTTGEYKWDQGRPKPDFFTVRGEGGPTIVGKVVYAGYDDGNLSALNLEDGATIWTRSLSGDQRQFVDVDTKPIASGDVLYVGAFSVGLYAVGQKSGEIRWLHPAKGVRSPALGAYGLYVTTGDKELHALDPATGKLKWRVKLSYGTMAAPVAAGDYVFVAMGDGILVVDALTGRVLARVTPDDGQSAAVAATGSWMHFVNNSGALMAARITP